MIVIKVGQICVYRLLYFPETSSSERRRRITTVWFRHAHKSAIWIHMLYVFIRPGGDKKLSGVNAEKMRQSKFQCDCTRTGLKAAVNSIKILLKNMLFHFPFLEKLSSVLQRAVPFCCFRCSSFTLPGGAKIKMLQKCVRISLKQVETSKSSSRFRCYL